VVQRAVISFLLVCIGFGQAFAGSLSGDVVSVADGDTITVLDASKKQHRVRLAGIDAPEKSQAFGNRSRQSLAQLVFRRSVTVDYEKSDRYGRIVGVVFVGDVDTNLEQIKRGMAWHYKVFEREQSATDRIAYADAEADARSDGRGLWADADPVTPWDFRRSR
jgi:endonuclease YncB( thermonuclease family)